MALPTTMDEFLAAYGNPITRDEVLAEKSAIEEGFIALALTVQEGEDRVRKHAYRHDGGVFDLLAERWIENQAFLRVIQDEEAADRDGDA